MNLIDLEILIPASPEFIWRFLGDLQQIPRWQHNADAVTFLSTQREGRGARWRQSMNKGPDRVVEVSAWYDTVGYMYQIVDGAAFSANQGHIKLREVPEGTLVRWTFQYELGGVFGGLRQAVGLKGSTAGQIQASLRNLHQLIAQQSGGISTHEAKASMQEAPDVAERSSYEPRHPSSYRDSSRDDATTQLLGDTGQEQPFAFDYDMPPVPALEEGDTQPNPVALSARSIAEPPPALDDTKPIELAVPVIDAPSPAAPIPASAPPEKAPLIRKPQPRRDNIDITTMSVFEVFGLQKPSQAGLNPDSAPAPAYDSQVREDSASRAPLEVAAPQTSESPPPESNGRGVITGSRRAARRRATGLRARG